MKNVTKLFLFCIIIQLISCQRINRNEKPYLLKIKMKETECLKCMNAHLMLNDFTDIAKMEVVFNGMSEKEINRFLEINSLDYLKEIADCDIISDKKVFADLNSNMIYSECYLLNRQGEQLAHFNFRTNDSTIKHLETLIRIGKSMMQEDKKIKLDTEYNNSLKTFSHRDGKLLLLNSSMNLVQIFDMNGRLLCEVDGTNINSLDIFEEMQPIDSTQVSVVNYLKNNGMLQSIPENAYINGETIWVGYNVPYLEMGGPQFRLRSYYELLSFDTRDNNKNFRVICDGRKDNIQKIIFDNEDSNISAVKVSYDKKNSTSLLSFDSYILSNDTLSMTYSKSINYPEFERQNNYAYEPKLKCGLLNLQGTDFLYDIKTDSVINLPFNCNLKVIHQGDYNFEVESDAFLLDWYSDGYEIGIIFKDIKVGKWYHKLLSMNGEVIDSRELSPSEYDIKNYYMTSPRTALCITNDNNLLTQWYN